MTAGLAARLLDLVWRNDPDLAIEAGRLPPVLWESLSSRSRDETMQDADTLIGEAAAEHDVYVAEATRYHARCTQTLARWRGVEILNHMTGPAARLSWAATSWPLALDPQADMYVERLQAFPSYCLDIARQSETWDLAGSRPVLDAFIAQVDAMVRTHDTADPPLLLPARLVGRSVPKDVVDGVRTGLAGLRSLAVNAARSAYPASSLPHAPDGAARYVEAIARGTSLPLSASQVENLGQAVLRRSQQRFDHLSGSTEPSFEPMPSGAAYLERMTGIHARLVAALPAVCSTIPEMPCVVVAMPEANATVGPPAFYGPSSQRNGRPGALFVNTGEPVIVRSWEALPLAMHEGVPGHHLQLALLDENPAIPDPLRLLSVNAFTEGWAVYSETLAGELGLDLSPADEFGLLTHQRWRAARLVVEVGLHVHGWSVKSAVTFMVDQTGLDRQAVTREVVRYLGWPGQALGYMVGAEAVSAWVVARRREGVPLATAHADLLRSGSIPLSVLDRHAV